MSNEPAGKLYYIALNITGNAWMVRRWKGAANAVIFQEQLLTTPLTDPDEVIKLAIEIGSWA